MRSGSMFGYRWFRDVESVGGEHSETQYFSIWIFLYIHLSTSLLSLLAHIY
jgi:hypothetical protein